MCTAGDSFNVWRELYERHAAPLPPVRPLLPPLLRLLLPQQVLLPHPSGGAIPASASAPGTPRNVDLEHHARQWQELQQQRQRAGEQNVDHESVRRLEQQQVENEGRSGAGELESSNAAEPEQQHRMVARRTRYRGHAGPAVLVPPATAQPPLPDMPKALQGVGSVPLPPRPAPPSRGPLYQQHHQQRLQESKPHERSQLPYPLTSHSSWHDGEQAGSGGGARAGATRGIARGMGLWPASALAPHPLLGPAPRSIDLVRSLPPPPYLTTARSQSYGYGGVRGPWDQLKSLGRCLACCSLVERSAHE